MRLPFLDRDRELQRVRAALRSPEGSLVVVYGRRRVGKSRLLEEALRGSPGVYYVGDQRDAALQRADLAREIALLVPGFGDVVYDGWEPLLARWRREAPDRAVLVLDEFPFLVRSSPELPSLLQKSMDRRGRQHVVVAGSSQRMMQGLVLDLTAPLYGGAREILRLEPLAPGWIVPAFGTRDPAVAIENYAAWGGTPRYWELARDYPGRRSAVEALVLDPLGVLHREPERLLLDDLDELTRAASVLALIGRGCHRISEIAGRIGVPATSLARPMARLVELGLVEREVPFGRSPRDTKRSSYRIADPFLSFWYRFVEPNRSRLARGQVASVGRAVERAWPTFLGAVWEDLARASIAGLAVAGREWSPAGRYWGPGEDGAPLEIDLIAEAPDGTGRLLVGEAKLQVKDGEVSGLIEALRCKAARWPAARGRAVAPTLFVVRPPGRRREGIVTAADVLRALR